MTNLDNCILVANRKMSDLTHEVIRKMKMGEYCEKEILFLEVLNRWRIILEEQKCENTDCGLDADAQELLCKKINLF
jgi:hypothetical protein